ncbi:MAG: DUF2807 domain-containing protein [Candidatus Azobacteroides sp.]|nr:DUF2807 domain-containing protein [Candidatus Azobacteroides sp.]
MKHSAQLFVFLFIAFPIFMSCMSCNFSGGTPVYGNHQLVNQRINIDDYEKIILNVPAEVFYQQFSDSAPYLQIHTDENIFDALNVRVENNQLIIDAKKGYSLKPSLFTIYTCSHNLNQVAVTGPGNICLKGEVNAEDFKLEIAGTGNLRTDSLLCDKITASITGTGSAELTGASNYASFTVTGTGDIRAFNYFVQELKCEIVGTGNIEAWVAGKLNANIVGTGDLSYRGNPPSVNKNIVGTGKMKSVD